MSETPRTPEPFTVEGHDGGRVAALLWNSVGGPGTLLIHATGFCKEVWAPVVDATRGAVPIAALDQRGHGDSSPINAPFDWWDLGRDALDVLGRLGWTSAVGVGHSSGAAALVMAELLRPGTLRAMVLVEPIVFPGPPYVRMEENPMSAGALRRRATFPSSDAVVDSYRGRGPFAHWDERVLRAYATHGFRADGAGGWTLKCAPEQEAEFYRGATLHGVWSRLGEVEPPVLVVGGAASTSHTPDFLRLQAEQFPHASVRIVDGASHFLPMEQVGVMAEIVGAVSESG